MSGVTTSTLLRQQPNGEPLRDGLVGRAFWSLSVTIRKVTQPALSFEVWKARLREDCERNNKLSVFDNFGDYVLEWFWQRGFEPTVQAVIGDRVVGQ
jgi:hypothetical protein